MADERLVASACASGGGYVGSRTVAPSRGEHLLIMIEPGKFRHDRSLYERPQFPYR